MAVGQQGQEIELSASLEDYLEAIFHIVAESRVARSKEISQRLGVARSSVTGALRLLAKKGLVHYQPYGYVTLTESGRQAAEGVVRKHNIISSFFANVLGVEADQARRAACEAEHALGTDVVRRLLCFIEFSTRENENGYDLINRFRKFCRDRLRDVE
jgi:DtxR family Mn-dependent transcriptional regulator